MTAVHGYMYITLSGQPVERCERQSCMHENTEPKLLRVMKNENTSKYMNLVFFFGFIWAPVSVQLNPHLLMVVSGKSQEEQWHPSTNDVLEWGLVYMNIQNSIFLTNLQNTVFPKQDVYTEMLLLFQTSGCAQTTWAHHAKWIFQVSLSNSIKYLRHKMS